MTYIINWKCKKNREKETYEKPREGRARTRAQSAFFPWVNFCCVVLFRFLYHLLSIDHLYMLKPDCTFIALKINACMFLCILTYVLFGHLLACYLVEYIIDKWKVVIMFEKDIHVFGKVKDHMNK